MFEIYGIVFIILFGFIGHFVYKWSNQNSFLGYFAPVNESVWEHIKLVLGPSFLWLLFEIHFYNGYENLWFAKFISLLIMILFIPILFYSYSKIIKKSIFIIDIGIFIISVIVGEIVFHYLINLDYNIITYHIGIIGLIILFIKYMTSTYTPGTSSLYKSPNNGFIRLLRIVNRKKI